VLTSIQQSFYDFRYDDEDTVLHEIEEFYSYVEMPQVAENLKAWQGSFKGGLCLRTFQSAMVTDKMLEWIKSSAQERKGHIELLLESLEHRATEVRFTNARRLFYLLQGKYIRLCLSILMHAPEQAHLRKLRPLSTNSIGYLKIAS
jgi:hypothetical protein